MTYPPPPKPPESAQEYITLGELVYRLVQTKQTQGLAFKTLIIGFGKEKLRALYEAEKKLREK